MKLIVGLGNPGTSYTYTRHNIGFQVVAQLAETNGSGRWQKTCNGLMTTTMIGEVKCSLLMPLTMMNNSGESVKAAVKKLGIELNDCVIVYDDMAIRFEQMRFRLEGSAGGHNGIKSIIAELGTQSFPRFRLGVGRAPTNVDAADYVLSKFTSDEQKRLPDFINNACLGVHSWVTQGAEVTMNVFNRITKD